jgi:hypothetical protein
MVDLALLLIFLYPRARLNFALFFEPSVYLVFIDALILSTADTLPTFGRAVDLALRQRFSFHPCRICGAFSLFRLPTFAPSVNNLRF